jgi:hypothetical protein
MEDTELNLDELRNVTALEAWCLAAAIASLVAAGDTNVSATITAIASDIYDKINGDTNDEG